MHTQRESTIGVRRFPAVLLLAAGLLGLPGSASAAVAVDNAAAGPVSTSNTLTISSFTTGSGSNRLMLVGISVSDSEAALDGSNFVSSVTYNGVALTQVCEARTASPENDDARAWIYRLINPPSVTANVVVTLNQAVNSSTGSLKAGVATFTGVDQTTPLGTCVKDEDDSTTMSVTVSSAAGELVFDVFASENAGSTMVASPAGRVQQWNVTGGPDSDGGGASTAPGAASVQLDWTRSGSASHSSSAGVAIKAAAAATGDQTQIRGGTQLRGGTKVGQ